MKKRFVLMLFAVLALPILSGFTNASEKAVSFVAIYGVAAMLSVVIFLVYVFGIKKKSPWFILLFSSIFVVNIGYLCLSLSRSLEEALLANRISYLGSVFLPMAMLMIILETVGKEYKKWFSGVLIGIGIVVFLIAASPGYLDIYYKEVTFTVQNGVGMLQKEYGSFHVLYLIYLMAYFFSMTFFIVANAVKRRITSLVHVIILLSAVLINIVVWLLEQLVSIDFEILSVSYVITELFLVAVCFLLQESQKQKNSDRAEADESKEAEKISVREEIPAVEVTAFNEESTVSFFETEEYKNFMFGLGTLTNAEKRIYDCYIEGKSTKEILAMLDITENTLKYHNKNIYGKLGVSSRKQLKEIAFKITSEKNA